MVDATVSDSVPVAELLPHLVDAVPGEHWQLSSPGGILRPEHCLREAGIRPGERLTLRCATVPAPPTDTVGRLSQELPWNPGAWIAATLVALATVILPPFSALTYGPLAWHPLEITDRARGVLDGAGDPGGVTATVCTAGVLVAALGLAAGSLHERRLVVLAAVLAFSAGVQVNVLTGCVLAAGAVWRPGPERVVTVVLALAAAANFWPGVTALAGMVGLTFAGQTALGIAGVSLPRIPATGLFAAARDGDAPADADDTTVDRALRAHTALVVAWCAVVAAGVVQLITPGSTPGWATVAGCLAVAVSGLSARGVRPGHSVAVTVTSVSVAVWTLVHCAGAWPVLAVLPVLLPLVKVSSPLAGRLIDILETVAFTVAVPLLLATTGVFDLVRGIG